VKSLDKFYEKHQRKKAVKSNQSLWLISSNVCLH